MEKFILAVSLATTLSSSFTHAALNGCANDDSNDKVNHVYYANGVDGSSRKNNIATKALRLRYKATLSARDGGQYDFSAAENETQRKMIDLAQVFQQKMAEEGLNGNPILLYHLLVNGFSIETVQNYYSTFPDAGELIGEFIELAAAFSSSAIEDTVITELRHLTFYQADLLAGKRVLIIPHSQGNLFTNTAVEAVIDINPEWANSISYFGVASPASYTANNADYVTADDDRVIALLDIVEDVLPANLDNDPGLFNDPRDLLNHGFTESYFNDSLSSMGVIDNGVHALVDNLEYPEIQAGQGSIRATLTWGSNEDVDLHAFEPDGSHVYYGYKIGSDGFLDVDNRSSFGPENYFVSCEDVNAGEYTFGVNYYSGNSSETAEIIISLGDGRVIGPRTQILPEPVGRAGNDTPIIMFNVTVTDDGDGNAIYSFE